MEYRSALGDAELATIDIALGWRLPPGLAARMPRLGWVCSTAAGVEKLLAPDLAPHVVVSRIVDPEQAAGIAQFVVTMVLRHARELERYAAQQGSAPGSAIRCRSRGIACSCSAPARWAARSSTGWAASACRARGWNRRSPERLTTLLGESEVVVCALPLTEATEGILDARAFAAMPRGGYVVNVARGAHLVEPDLIAAVRSGHLAGAALDVQRKEPMPDDDPLWSVPGITITPHIAAQSSPEVIAGQFVAALRAQQRGERAPNAIDRSLGY